MTDAAIDATAVAAPRTGLRHGFAPLRHRDFAVFWSAATVSNTGSWMQMVTVPYVVYALTGSTAWVGLTAFTTFMPGVISAPLAGPIADRFSRRAVLVVTTSIQTVVALGFWALWVSGAASPGNLLAVLVVASVAGNINITAWQSFVPSLVPQDDLLAALRLNTVQFTAARAVGPAIAGLVLASFGAGVAFMGNALSFLAVLGALAVVSPRPTPLAESGASMLRQFREGVAYVRARPTMWQPVLSIFVVSLLPSALVQLAPAFADKQFGASKTGYGLLVAAYGAGSVFGSLFVASHADARRRSVLALAGLIGSLCGVLLLSSTTIFGVGVGALVVMGFSYVTVTISLSTSMHAWVDEVFRGRAVSLYLVALQTGLPVGALVLGSVADGIGLRATMLCVAALLGTYWMFAVTRLGALRAID